MADLYNETSVKNGRASKRRAVELLRWLADFLPTAIPSNSEEAILDTSGDVNALLWHRSELQAIIDNNPAALTPNQKRVLAELDEQMRQAALLIVGAEKGHLRRFREGHYDRSHWWWYLDDILQEELRSQSRTTPYKELFSETQQSLTKVAEKRSVYDKKSRASKK